MSFKDKLNEIFNLGAPTVVVADQDKPRDVIELTPIEDFRNNIRQKLNGIKSDAVMGVVTNAPSCGASEVPTDPNVLVERENEIGLDTLKGSIIKMGPQKVSEVVAKMSVEKKEVDKKTGIATSEFEKFVGGLKQEAAEALLGAEATPAAAPEAAAPEGATPEAGKEAPKTPEQKLPDLVQNKL